MKEEIRIHIYSLSAYTSMDLLVSSEVTLDELCHVAASMMEKCTHGAFQAYEEVRLIKESDKAWLSGSKCIKEIPILTGETLYLL